MKMPAQEERAIALPDAAGSGQADRELRSWITERGIPSLPFADGRARLRSAPCFVPSRRMKALRSAASALCRAYDELCDILARDPSHLSEFFSLTPLQKMLWYSSGSLWHGIARADIFCTNDGRLAVAEVNSDTPSGLDEAFLLGEFAEQRFPGFMNPNRQLRDGFLSVIRRACAGLRSRPARPAVALIYPTDIPEDQGMIVLYQAWLREAGFNVLLGSPSNLERGENGRASLFGTDIDLLFRHYKTDWWCERVNIWKDARSIPDPAPLLRELHNVIEPMAEGNLAVVNPFGAVVTQSKLSLAFFHEKRDLFSADAQETIRRYIPETARLPSIEPGVLEQEKDDWVLKSDYGCEGAEVIVGRLTGTEAWSNALRLAEPAHWVAQRYFQAERQDSGFTENYGVYLAGGEPCGLYVRLARGVTGTSAVVVPALERPPLAGLGPAEVRAPGERHPCDARVRDLLRAYTPSDQWLPFRMSLLLHSAAESELAGAFEHTGAVARASGAGTTLAGLIAGAEEEIRRSLLIITDLDGVESVSLASQVSDQADIVIQFENIAHSLESVPLRGTLGALIHFAPIIAGKRAGRTPGKGGPAALILERRRLDPIGSELRQFNNRHWAYLPAISALEELGIHTILYIHPEGAKTESDDLNEDFVQYAGSHIRLCYASPVSLEALRSRGLSGFLEATQRTPVRRETVFSYMLPREEENRAFAYNQEAPRL